MLNKKQLEEAKGYVLEYIERESWTNDNNPCYVFRDLEDIAIGYTTLTDDDIPVQFTLDLINMNIKVFADDKLMQQNDVTLEELKCLDFDDLIYGWSNRLSQSN